MDTVHIAYPNHALVSDDPTKSAVVLRNAVDRRDLVEPLVDLPSVIDSASQFNWSGSSFFLFINKVDVHALRFHGHGHPPALASMRLGGALCLLYDLTSIQHAVGETQLEMMTYQTKDTTDGGDHAEARAEVRLIVKRTSTARAENEDELENSRGYDFPLDPLHEQEGESAPKHHPVVPLMLDLVYGRSIRAIRYVMLQSGQAQMGVRGAPEPTMSRKVKFGDALVRLLKTVSPSTYLEHADALKDDRVASSKCLFCKEPYDLAPDAPHRAVALPCGHVMGFNCTIEWVNTDIRAPNGTRKLPLCPNRCLIFPNAGTLLRREYNGTYFNQSQFTPYENFEISCTDLDDAPSVLQAGSGTTIQAQLALAATAEFVQANNGVKMTRRSLCATLLNVVMAKLLARFKQTAYPRFLTEEQKANLSVQKWLELKCAPARPGFYEHLLRIIHRMVYFRERRECECQPGSYHVHGARTY